MNQDSSIFEEIKGMSEEEAYLYVKKIAKQEIEEEQKKKDGLQRLEFCSYIAIPALLVLLALSLFILAGMTTRKNHYKQIHNAYRMYLIDSHIEPDTQFMMNYRGTNPTEQFYEGRDYLIEPKLDRWGQPSKK